MRICDAERLEPTIRKRSARRGAALGCLAALVFWWFPIPVVAVVWLFDLPGPFGDTMLAAIPVFLALPVVGWMIGLWVGRRRPRRGSREA